MNKKEKIIKNNGITLIALVITIIVLIILAGISINLILGENGIIKKAGQAKEAQTESEIKEKVEMMLAEYAIEREINNKTLLEFIQNKKNNQEIDEVTENEDGKITVQLNGYSVVIDVNKLSIINIDKNEKTTIINLSAITARLNETITVTVKFAEEIDYSKCKWVFSTQKEIVDETNYTNEFISSENTIDLKATEEGIFYLNILVVDRKGNKTQKVSEPIKVGNFVTKIILDKTHFSIEVGKEETIVATVEPDDASNKEIEWTSSDSTIATVDETGKVIAVKAGNATITATAKDLSGTKTTCSVEVTEKQPVDVSTIEKGIFIEYDVEYTDTYHSSYKYTSIDGWRLLDYKTRDDGKTLYDVKLISTGVPARMYYKYDHKINNYSKWVTDAQKLEEFKRVLGNEYNHYTGNSEYVALQAAAGYYYNLGEMTFTQGTSYNEYNMGYYAEVKNGNISYTTGSKLGNELFKAREDASIRMLTLPELNISLGRTDIDSIAVISDTTGLYQLNKLSNVLIGKSYSGATCWIASPLPGYNALMCTVTNGGSIDNSSGNYNGVRPVVSISSDIKLAQETDESGFLYYSIVK